VSQRECLCAKVCLPRLLAAVGQRYARDAPAIVGLNGSFGPEVDLGATTAALSERSQAAVFPAPGGCWER
jgi:hypothetical protein